MIAFTIRRLFQAIPILLASTFLVYLLVGSSVDPMSPYYQKKPLPSPEQLRAIAHHYGLDHPLPVRYWNWLTGLVLHGDFGVSTQGGYNIGSDLGHAIGVTLRLITAAIVVSLVLAIVVGVTTAVRQYTKLDYLMTGVGFLFLSLPTFWFAILLKELAIQFNTTTNTHFFQTLWESSSYVSPGLFSHVVDSIQHLILPTIVLSLISYAAWSRFQRASMLDVLNSDYMRLARSKGLSPRRVLVKHGLRTALIPLTTQVALDTAGLLGGAIITETVFQWHGMGTMFFQAIGFNDVNPVMAWLLVAALFVVLFNLLADLLYAVLDPRIRLA